MIISPPTLDDATGDVAVIYAEDIESMGYVPSHTLAMAMNPEAYRIWEQLTGAISRPMGKRRYELVTIAAATAIRSRSCLLAHVRKTLDVMTEEELLRVAADYRDAGLSEAEVAMMDYARKVSTSSSEMTDADSVRLREVGFTDKEIVDITLAAAARNYYARALHALGVEPDVPSDLSPRLRDAFLGSL
jgi:uncharacterized peroxidase-related enzyme